MPLLQLAVVLLFFLASLSAAITLQSPAETVHEAETATGSQGPRVVQTLTVGPDGKLITPGSVPQALGSNNELYTPVSPELRDALLSATTVTEDNAETVWRAASSDVSSTNGEMVYVGDKDLTPRANAKELRRVLTESSPDPTLEETIRRLLSGTSVIDSPNKMQVDQTRRVTVRIGSNVPEAQMLFQERPDRQVQTTSMKVTRYMRVTLSSPSFAIKEISPLRQLIVPGTPTEWEFDLKAIEAGQATFVVQFWLIIKQDDEVEKMLISREQSISVEVRPKTWDEWMDGATKSLNTASGLLTAGASFLSLLVGILISQVWRVLANIARAARGFVAASRSRRTL